MSKKQIKMMMESRKLTFCYFILPRSGDALIILSLEKDRFIVSLAKKKSNNQNLLSYMPCDGWNVFQTFSGEFL